MLYQVKTDISNSVLAFNKVVLPKLKELNFLDGRFISIEEATANGFEGLAAQFDLLSGIDIWYIKEGAGITGIANRIQWGSSYNSFTIRYNRITGGKTEYIKRLDAMNSNGCYIYPHYTIQSYINKNNYPCGELLSLAIAKTDDIFALIKRGKPYCDIKYNRNDGNSFYVVYWDKIEACGFDIKIFKS